MKEGFQDVAIALAWPEQTARGDEKWMKILKNLKIVKNLNFKVGHAAILLIQRSTGRVYYYDFGRYICPRGMGRARSLEFDPNLEFQTRAIWKHHKLWNLKEILNELHNLKKYTHGEGIIYCGLAYSLSFEKAKKYADKTVEKGIIPYGAFALKNNNCSRFVAQIMAEGMLPRDPRRSVLLLPNSIKPSPISNVVYADKQHVIYTYRKEKLHSFEMRPRQGLSYLLKQMWSSFKTSTSILLPQDGEAGELNQPLRVINLPIRSQWLGGIGEGAWWNIHAVDGHYAITKYNKVGEKLYEVLARIDAPFNLHEEYCFTYDMNVKCHIIEQNGMKISFHTLHILFIENKNQTYETEYLKIKNSHG